MGSIILFERISGLKKYSEDLIFIRSNKINGMIFQLAKIYSNA